MLILSRYAGQAIIVGDRAYCIRVTSINMLTNVEERSATLSLTGSSVPEGKELEFTVKALGTFKVGEHITMSIESISFAPEGTPQVKFGINAPREISVHRESIYWARRRSERRLRKKKLEGGVS